MSTPSTKMTRFSRFSNRSDRTRMRDAAPPTLNVPNIAYTDVFEADDEEESDDGLYDSSDEETSGAEEDHLSDLNDSKPVCDVTIGKVGSASEGIVDSPVDGRDQSSHDGQLNQENKFVAALMNAAQSYSTRLRFPLSSSVAVISKRPGPSSPDPEYLHEVLSDSDESDDSDSCESGFSTDKYEDAELLSDRPSFTAEQAAQLLYQPSGLWAGLVNSPIENPVVIAELNAGAMCEAYIKQGILGGRTITYISKTWILSQSWEGFFSEMAIYSDPTYLRSLQGIVIPRIIGVYLVDGAVSVAMELPSSDFWVEASQDMSNHLKRKCISAFDKIHERGVLHNDVELRHMLIGSQGNVTIIDFQESRAMKPKEEVGLNRTTDAEIRIEKRKLRFKLSYGNSREQEIERVKRLTKREDEKQQRLLRRSKKAAGTASSGQKNTPCEQDEESEPEDPDLVLNPVVDPQTWSNCWLGEPFVPTCYIVPGQDQVQVCSAIQEFLMEELDRQEADVETNSNDRQGSCAPGETSPSRAPLSTSPSTTNTPILPTRINLKRGRDTVDDASDDPPSPKKRQCSPCNSKSGNSLDISPPEQGSQGGGASPSTGSTDVPGSAVPSIVPVPVRRRLLVPEIHVPFEGYSGPDGYILHNMYTPEQISIWRRIWIRQHSIQRCIEEGLPYPLGEIEKLLPSTLPEPPPEFDSTGKKKKRKKPQRSLGNLRRASRSDDEYQKRASDAALRKKEILFGKEPGTGLESEHNGDAEPSNDSASDGILEGPRIISLNELKELYSRSPLSGGNRPTQPSKSILRRQLNPAEKARNVAILEKYKKWYEPDTGRDTDTDTDSDPAEDAEDVAIPEKYKKRHEPDTGHDADVDSDPPRPTKRPRTRSSPPATPIASTSGSGGGSQKHSATPNTFAERSDKQAGPSSSSGIRLPYFLSFWSKRPTTALITDNASQPGVIPHRDRHNALPSGTANGGDQASASLSGSTSTFSGIVSDSDDSSDENDAGPSSSAWPPRRRRRHRRARHKRNSSHRHRFGPGISLEELDGLRVVPRGEGDVTGMDTMDNQRDGRTWAGFKFKLNFPWRWPTLNNSDRGPRPVVD